MYRSGECLRDCTDVSRVEVRVEMTWAKHYRDVSRSFMRCRILGSQPLVGKSKLRKVGVFAIAVSVVIRARCGVLCVTHNKELHASTASKEVCGIELVVTYIQHFLIQLISRQQPSLR
jgi:hypothetical protein